MDLLSLALAMSLFTQAPIESPVGESVEQSLIPIGSVMVENAPLSSCTMCSAGCSECNSCQSLMSDCCGANRRPFESDHCFDGFINPITNPVLSKDPRSSTYARLLFINNNIPGSSPFGGGDLQAYAMQVNIALTERLAFTADKDGYAQLSPKAGGNASGWLNLAAGLKYTLIRDVENQFLFATGLLYEMPSGSEAVFQSQGGGIFTPYITYAKEFGEDWHFMGTHGYSFGVDQTANSSFFYHSLHLDREFFDWFYPLVELNWFQYTQGGDVLPRAIGEGDGLINFGTQGMAGRQMLSLAVGAAAKLTHNIEAGAAYEIGVSGYKGVLNNRIVCELILRY